MITLPDVSRLPCDTLSSADGQEYMRRYYRMRSRTRSERFHHILASDPGADMHDHPWDFVSQLLQGCYVEYTPAGSRVYRAPCVIRRKAEMPHRLELPEGDVWTYVVLGRARRTWGFWTPAGWVPWRAYRGESRAGAARCLGRRTGIAHRQACIQ